jgi:predicted negative regulator of RcsB-dependent stress response
MTWLVWVLGAAVIAAAGVGVVAWPWWRDRDMRRRTAWSAARAAIDSAAVSRDAASSSQLEAEQLLARAETIAAAHGGTRAARTAEDHARRADALWQAAARG